MPLILSLTADEVLELEEGVEVLGEVPDGGLDLEEGREDGPREVYQSLAEA